MLSDFASEWLDSWSCGPVFQVGRSVLYPVCRPTDTLSEHVAEFTLDIVETPLSQRGKHVSLHFDDQETLDKWISIFSKQKQIESSKVIASSVFLPVETKKRLSAAVDRSAEHRHWVDRKAHREWLRFQRECQQWDMDPDVIRRFPPQDIKFGETGVLLGISCIINPEDGRQTNLLYPFAIDEPPAPKQKRRKPFLVVRLNYLPLIVNINSLSRRAQMHLWMAVVGIVVCSSTYRHFFGVDWRGLRWICAFGTYLRHFTLCYSV